MKILKLIFTFFVLGLSFIACSKSHQKQSEDGTKADSTVDTVEVSESDEAHIKFNGATFGTSIDVFLEGLAGCSFEYEKKSFHHYEIYNPAICDGYFTITCLNAEVWNCLMFCSLKTSTVFRTTCTSYWEGNLKANMALLVAALEEKYGGHVQEGQSDLGYIYYCHQYSNDKEFIWRSLFEKYKEMMAFRYRILDSDKQVVGEVRIAVAPSDSKGNTGYLGLTYTDENAKRQASEEYWAIMDNAL